MLIRENLIQAIPAVIFNRSVIVILYLATRRDVFSHGLPTPHKRLQQLCVRRANAAAPSPDASTIPSRH